jgi:hypothetical protein
LAVDPHRTAVLSLLRAPGALPSPIAVYDDAVPNDTLPPYVRVFMKISYPDMTDLTNRSNRAMLRILCHCVGETSTAADVVAGAVRTVLLDAVPTVAGRACFPIRNESGADARPDESTGTLVMDAIEIYTFSSVPG